MFRRLFRRSLPAAALLIALAWPAHVALTDRSVADLGCQVSALASSSELNSDCGSRLLELPFTFRLVKLELPVLSYVPVPAGSFRGRAPPSR
jgi:hypothetical protein